MGINASAHSSNVGPIGSTPCGLGLSPASHSRLRADDFMDLVWALSPRGLGAGSWEFGDILHARQLWIKMF